MNEHVLFRNRLIAISTICIMFIIPLDKSCAQNASDFIYVQSIPTNSRVYLIKEADKYKNWESDQKNFVGATPLTKRIVEGDYLLVVRSQKSAGKTFFNKQNINDGEIESGYLVVGDQGQVDLYKQYHCCPK